MAYDSKNLGTNDPALRGSAPTIYTYGSTVDNIAAIKAAGYFNGARERLSVGDVIWAAGTDATEGLRVAAVPATGNVTVDANTWKQTA